MEKLMEIRSETAAPYTTTVNALPPAEDLDRQDRIIAEALEYLAHRMLRADDVHITSPDALRNYLKLKLARLEHEVFFVVFMTNRHRVIAFEEMFRGTIDGSAVHPREVLKRVLHHNAAAVIFAHNHPSGVAEPSRADETITRRLQDALALIDVRVLDHIVVADDIVSFAERGLL